MFQDQEMAQNVCLNSLEMKNMFHNRKMIIKYIM